MKKQINPTIRAHLIRGAFYLLLLFALCVIPFAFGRRATSTQSGTLLAFFGPEVPTKPSERTLTFAEHVAYQRAIEEVYWRHRIWPKERPDPKSSLGAVMSQAQLEKKVADYLRNSQALEDYWHHPITTGQLQVEMDRMARHTKQPEVLRELFEALGNDPFVIAECLARPILSEHLKPATVEWHKASLDSWRAGAENQMPKLTAAASTNYTLPAISDGPNGCIDDTWRATSTTGAPSDRDNHTAVWTGSEMIIWGGWNGSRLNTGGRYNPSTDSWTATSTTNAPSGRELHTAVWTGSEMIVWGGSFGLNTGGRYSPGTDSWTATSTSNAPEARGGHTAVWTGSEMIVWGGRSGCCTYHNTGGRYNPSTDSWTATSTTNAPAPGFYTAVWTSSEMIVWGGLGTSAYLNTGGRYPAPFDTPNPSPTATPTATVTASPTPSFGTGGRYDPGTDSWRATSTTNAPTARVAPAVWTGSEMIVWGGAAPFTTNTGGRYCAQFAPPTPTPTPTATATATPTPTATSTPRPTPTPRSTPPARPRPTPVPRP